MTASDTYTTFPKSKQALIISDLMDLFKSNSRGYGVGEFVGAKFNEDKQKWIPGHVRWTWGETTAEQWHLHLSGKMLLGQGVLCDDGKCSYSCLDVDIYDIDYFDEMHKITKSSLPLVVFRTKSGGLRIAVFFSEPIESELVITRMRRIASQLGYAGCEIFPKQTQLDVEHGDCPSWIYVPFGGTNGIFPEQGCMTDNGGLMELEDAISFMKANRISQSHFLELFAEEETAKANGKSNGKKHPKGSWIQEDTYETTLNTMFCDGPPCLWTIGHQGSTSMQNNFLLNVVTFCKKKYPENWQKAVEWVNYNVLKPAGDRDRLNEMIKRSNAKDYEYRCHDEPICQHCNPHACRRMPYGVGSGSGADHYELGLTRIEREPLIYYANVGEKRVPLEINALANQNRLKEAFLSYGVVPLRTMKSEDFNTFINKSIEEAASIKPPRIMRSNASEIETLMIWFSIYVPTFLRVGEKPDDKVRLRVEGPAHKRSPAERRIYFKWQSLSQYCRSINYPDSAIRRFVFEKCEHHEQGPGFRDWWRNTHSISFEMLEEDRLEKWLSEDEPPINREGNSNDGN